MKSPEQWIEIWIDSASKQDFVYVLILRTRIDGHIEVVDPQKRGVVINTFTSYQEATSWLNEDEYELVEGRWVIEDN